MKKKEAAFYMGALAFELLNSRGLTEKILVTRSDLQFQQQRRCESNGGNKKTLNEADVNREHSKNGEGDVESERDERERERERERESVRGCYL